MANFNGQPNVIESDRLDHWMAYLFGIAVAVGPISPALMGVLLVPAMFILVPRFFACYGVGPLKRYMKTTLGICLITLFTWFLITSAFSIKPDKSFQVAIRTAVMVLVVTMLYHYVKERSGLAFKILRISTIAFVGWALFAVFLLYFSSESFDLLQEIINKNLDVRTFFKNDAALSIIYMPLVIVLFLNETGLKKVLCIVAVALIIALVMNGAAVDDINRAALVGLAVAFIGAGCFFLIRNFTMKRQVVFIVFAVFVALIAKILILEKLPQITKIGGTPPAATLPFPDHHRQVIWSFVYDKVKENPLVGVGIDSVKRTEFADVRMAYHKSFNEVLNTFEYALYGEYVPSHPHNWMLEIASETGVLGLILLVLCLIQLTLLMLRTWKEIPEATPIVVASFFMLVGFWSSSMANFSIWSAWWLISFFVMMALMMAVATDGSAGNQKK